MEFTWFALDCNIWTNPKVLKLANALKLDVDTAVSKLGRIWSWAKLCGSEDGDVSYIPADEIADIARWKKKPEALMKALIECGFIELNGDRKFLHGWSAVNGKFEAKKRQDKERKFRGNSTEIPRNKNGNSTDTRQDITIQDNKSTVVVVNSARERVESEQPFDEALPTLDNEVRRVISAYANKINPTAGDTSIELLKGFTEDLGAEVVLRAFDIALDERKTSWSYINGILKNWKSKGVRCIADIERLDAEHTKRTDKPKGESELERKKRILDEQIAEEELKNVYANGNKKAVQDDFGVLSIGEGQP